MTVTSQREAVAKWIYETHMKDRGISAKRGKWSKCPEDFREGWLKRADELLAITQKANPKHYHDGYTCPENAACVGELRHELLVDPLDGFLPDSAPVAFVLTWNGREYPLQIQGGSVSQLEATIDLSFQSDDQARKFLVEDILRNLPKSHYVTVHMAGGEAGSESESGQPGFIDLKVLPYNGGEADYDERIEAELKDTP